ncbi:MAG: PspC domain-containing protein [Deltaproteobacteria bacterium]|nr:PspC domain-containing protein [Deltaproteobacteria bacterium]
MEKVIHASLGGNAFAFEEAGYQAVRAYLDQAARALASDPDRAEIVADLEQALAEKCRHHLGPHKTVVSSAEVARALEEMGPVRSPAEGAPAAEPAAPAGVTSAAAAEPPVRRFYRVLEGALLGGICSGLGAYFRIDANLVRAAAVVLAFLTHGLLVLVYLVLFFVIPAAGTPEERAAARGLPFSAQNLVDEARRKAGPVGSQVASAIDHLRSEWRHKFGEPFPGSGEPLTYERKLAAGLLLPLLAAASAAVAVFSLYATAALLNGHLTVGVQPQWLPLWAALLVIWVVTGVIGLPLSRARHALQRTRFGTNPFLAGLDGLLWLAFAALFAWLVWHSTDEWQTLLQDAPAVWQRLLASLPRGTRGPP